MPSKKPSLRENGCLNSAAKDVRDKKFQELEFFDPDDLVQVKYEMLRRVETEGHSVVDATRDFGYSRLAYYRTREKFEQEGVVGLVPRSEARRAGTSSPARSSTSFSVSSRQSPSCAPLIWSIALPSDSTWRFIPAVSSGHFCAEKKTPPESIDPRPLDRLVEGYERLRKSVLEGDRFEATRRGLSVFLSQGMAAWMKVYKLLDEGHAAPSRVSFSGAKKELASEIAELMAEVFLRHKEESRC